MTTINLENILAIDLDGAKKEFEVTKQTAIDLTNFAGNQFTTDGTTLTISTATDPIKITNYKKLKYFRTNPSDDWSDIIESALITYTGSYTPKGTSVTGTDYNDIMDYHTESGKFNITSGKGNDTITGGDGANVINTGDGNDSIIGSAGADTITGGKGENVLDYSGLTSVSHDVINLTKGETLNIKNLSFAGVSVPYKQGTNKNDLVINHQYGTVTLKNYYSKDLGATVLIDGTVNPVIDRVLGLVTADNYFAPTGQKVQPTYNGSVLADNVDASGLASPTNAKTGAGVTVNTGLGEDVVKGSDFKDTINTGDGNDTIIASGGADTLTTGKGENVIDYSTLDKESHDVINLTKGEELRINGLNIYSYAQSTNKNDLIINHEYGTVTLKNYYSKDLGATVLISGTNPVKNIVLPIVTAENYFEVPGQKVKPSYTGSALADYVYAKDLSAPTNAKTNAGVTINTGLGNDDVKGSNYRDVINTGDGNDLINASAENDTITGGKGINDLSYYGSEESFGDDVVNLTKGEELNINGITFDAVEPEKRYTKAANNNDLIIKHDKGSVTLKNYYSKDLGATVSINGYDLSHDALMDTITAANYFAPTGKKVQNKYVGSVLADNVDASGLTVPTNVKTNAGVTIQTGLGDDLIKGSNYSDSITGGLGKYTIKYDTADQLDGDKITLTKGENLKIDVSAFADTATYKIVGNNLEVTTGGKTFTILNFGKTDVTNNSTKTTEDSSGVFLKLSGSSDEGVNLRTVFKSFTVDKNYTGTWHKENIDASGYTIVDKKTEEPVIWTDKLKGLTIDGGANDDTITGSQYADNIKGGAGDDSLIGSKGYDSFTGGAGYNVIKYTSLEQLDGDKIYLTKGENLYIDMRTMGYSTSFVVNKNDLDVTVGGKTFKIMNFGASDVTNNGTKSSLNTSSVEVNIGGSVVNLRDDLLTLLSVDKNYTGTWHADNITAVSAKKGITIDGKGGNDLIVGSGFDDNIKAGTTGNSTISGGLGNDKLFAGTDAASKTTFIFGEGHGDDTITSGKGTEDTIRFDSSVLNKVYFTQDSKNKKDLIIAYSGGSITIKNYYKNGNNISAGCNSSIKYISTGDEIYEIYDYAKSVGSFLQLAENWEGKEDPDFHEGTKGNDTIRGLGGDDTLIGGGGHDSILGGDGNDSITGGAGRDTIYGGPGADVIDGGDDTDYIRGNAGDDIIDGGAANDNIEGDGGNDSINGGEDDDRIYGDFGNDTILGGDGADQLYGGEDDDYIEGGAGNDIIEGDAGSDTIIGGAGNDYCYTGSGNNVIEVGQGDDVVDLETNGYATINVSGEDGTLDVVFRSDSGNAVINSPTLLSRITFDYKGDPSIFGYQSGDDYVVLFRYSSGNQKTATLKNFDYSTYKDMVDFHAYNSGATYIPLSTKHLEGYDGTGELIFTAEYDNNYSSSDNLPKYVIGNDGDDTISTGTGNDYLAAAGGNNKITTAGAIDGKNVVTSGAGDDTITITGTSNNTVETSGGDNVIDVAGKNISISTGTGADTINVSSSGTTTINAGDGQNTITGSFSGGSVTTGNSNDIIDVTNTGALSVNAGTGYNEISVNGGTSASITSGYYDDTISATISGAAYINAGNGNNTITGSVGGGTIIGGGGEDTINVTNTGDLSISTDYHSDKISVTGGTSVSVQTSSYNDTITISNAASATVNGGGGFDSISVTGATGNVSVVGGDNADRIVAKSTGNVSVNAGDGNNNVTIQGADVSFTAGSGSNDISVTGTGAITIDAPQSDGVIDVTGGSGLVSIVSGNNWDTITSSSTGDVIVNAGDGRNEATITGANISYTSGKYDDIISFTASGNATINSGNGNSTVTGSLAGGSITGGSGYDQIFVTNTGALTVDAGSNNNNVSISGGSSVSVSVSGDYGDTINVVDAATVSVNSTSTGSDTINVTGATGLVSVTTTGVGDLIGVSTSGNAVVDAGTGANQIILNAANSTISAYGSEDDNSIDVTSGTSIITTGAGSDDIDVSISGNATISAGNGANEITGSVGGGSITSGSGYDIISLSNSGDLIVNAGGYSNKVTITGGSSVSVTTSGSDKDTIDVIDAANVSINSGTGGNDSIGVKGATGNVSIVSGAGADTINVNDSISSGGNVSITAGAGNNVANIYASSINYTSGDNDDDVIAVSDGNIAINAGAGKNDIDVKGDGNSTVTGGAGSDYITINKSGENVVNVGAGYNEVSVLAGTNTITGSENSNVTIEGATTNTVNLLTGGYNRVIVSEGSASTNTINFGSSFSQFIANGGTTNNVSHNGGNDDHNYVLNAGSTNITMNTSTDRASYTTITGGTNTITTSTTGDDYIYIYNGDNTITKESEGGYVTIVGGTNKVYGGSSSDTISVRFDATESYNTIYGGEGADVISADAGNNVIYGGKKPAAGDYTGYDTGTNTITAGVGTSVIYAGNSGDHITAGKQVSGDYTGTATIIGGAGDDIIYAPNALNTTISGGAGDDDITSGRGDVSINGGAGNDYINVRGETNTILGGAGNDTIYVYSHATSANITTGRDNDHITLSEASTETLNFAKGDGNDTINGYSDTASKRVDTINFTDSHLNEITAHVTATNDLVISYNGGADKVTLYYAVDDGGEVLTTINTVKTLDGSISMATFLSQRLIYTMAGDEAEYTGSPLGEKIIGNALNNTIDGAAGDDTILGGDGDDVIGDQIGSNVIEGGDGNDTLYAYTDFSSVTKNTFVFNKGDGDDVIKEIDTHGEKATLKFDISSFDELEFVSVVDSSSSDDQGLLIKYNGGSDSVFINTQYDDYLNLKVQYEAAEVVYEKSLAELLEGKRIIPASRYMPATVNGTVENDFIYTRKDVTIFADKGNDTIYAVGYDENHDGKLDNVNFVCTVFNIDNSGNGDGHDVIVNSNGSSTSYIVFRGVGESTSDVTAQEAFLGTIHAAFSGDDLVITYGADDSTITIKNYKEDGTGSNIKYFQFEYWNAGSSQYERSVNYPFSTYLYIDRTVTEGEKFIGSTVMNENITGTLGDDTINPGALTNRVDVLAGEDVLEISKQYNSEHEPIWDCNYYIYMGTDDTPDVIWFKDVTSRTGLSVNKSDNDLYIYSNDTYRARVYLVDYFTYAGPEGSPTWMQIKVGDGTGDNSFNLSDIYSYYFYNSEAGLPVVNGTVFDDLIYTKDELAEQINTGLGDDTIENYGEGDFGADTIHAGSGNDMIEYDGQDAAYNEGLRVYGDAGNDSITVPGGIIYGGTGSDYIEIGTHGGKYESTTIYGGTGDEELDLESDSDTIIASHKTDLIYGSKGNDLISGRGGNDVIYGGSGNDTIEGIGNVYEPNCRTTIIGGDGDDVIVADVFVEEYTPEDYQYNHTSGQTVINGGSGDDYIVANVQDYVVPNKIWGDSGNDTIIAYENSQNEYHVKSGDGNDVIYSTNRANIWYDKIIFDDIAYDGSNIIGEYNSENNELIIKYDYNGGTDSWDSSITVRNYLKDGYTPDTTLSTSNIKSGLDIIVDQTGREIYIPNLIKTTPVVDQESGTVFSDYMSGDEHYSMYGNNGSDTIIGSDHNNYLYGDYVQYDITHYGEAYGSGDDYLDGKSGENDLYGGFGDDTIIGGYDSNTDEMYGGEGANTYVIKSMSLTDGKEVAKIYSLSGKDTIIFENVATNNLYFELDDNDLKVYLGPEVWMETQNYITLKDWKNRPADLMIKGYGSSEAVSMLGLMAVDTKYVGDANFVNGSVQSDATQTVVFGSKNADTIPAYLSVGTSRYITSGGGADSIVSAGYNDTIYAGDGNDIVASDSGTGHDGEIYIDGGYGNDTITASGDSSYMIIGGAGSDSITGGAGDDIIYTNSRAYKEALPTGQHTNIYANELDLEAAWRPVETVGAGEITDTVIGGAGNDIIIALGENTNLQGGLGDDHYHVTKDNVTKITDASGTNKLYIHSLDDGSSGRDFFAMNINQAGEFVDGSGILIMNQTDFYRWAENGGAVSEGSGLVELMNGSGTVSEIYSVYQGSGKVMRSADLEGLKESVVSWLNDAEHSYADVATALQSEDADSLVQIFTNYSELEQGWHDV